MLLIYAGLAVENVAWNAHSNSKIVNDANADTVTENHNNNDCQLNAVLCAH